MQVKVIVIAIHYALREIGHNYRMRQAAAAKP